MLGLVIAKLFNSPSVETTDEGRMALQEEYDYGYGICAPLISKFAVWLYGDNKKRGSRYYFVSGKRWLFDADIVLYDQRSVQRYVRTEGIYFYTSRKRL